MSAAPTSQQAVPGMREGRREFYLTRETGYVKSEKMNKLSRPTFKRIHADLDETRRDQLAADGSMKFEQRR
jgi:hypothetical protein